MLTLLLNTRLLSFKTTSPFCHEWQRISHLEGIISSSLEELASSSSSSSSSSTPSSPSSFVEAFGEGGGEAVKPPRQAYHYAIQPTRVYTWHNSSLRVSRWASMHWSCAVMASRVTPPFEEEGAMVEGIAGVAGSVVSILGRFGRSWASLRWIEAALMAPMIV